MRNKFLRLLAKDVALTLRLVLIVGSVFLIVALVKKSKSQAQEFVSLKEKRLLVSRIPDLEYDVRQLEIQKTFEKADPKKTEFTLDGIILGGNRNWTILNGEVRREGDMVGAFIIAKVTATTVTLRNKNTKAVIKNRKIQLVCPGKHQDAKGIRLKFIL